MVKRWVARGCVIAAATALGFGARPAAAQSFAWAQFGNASYSDDEFCLDSPAFITSFAVGYSMPLIGLSAEYNNSDWPWPPPPPPPGGETTLFLSHGNAFQIMAELTPGKFINSGLNRYIRPFVGVGLHISTDGDAVASSGTRGPTYGVKGQTRPFVGYGVHTLLPLGSSRFGLTGSYRGTSVFFSDFELITPGGGTETEDGKTLTSGAWSVGFTFRLGGQ